MYVYRNTVESSCKHWCSGKAKSITYSECEFLALVTKHAVQLRPCPAAQHMLLLESCLQTCMTYTIAECTVNKLLMMDRGTVRNM